MPDVPHTYLDLQILFQDRYEAAVKPLGTQWILSTDIILEYLYASELEIVHELASNGQYTLLRGYTITEDMTGVSLTTIASNVWETDIIDLNYLVKSYSTVNATYTGVDSFSGVVENKEIREEDAGLYYTTAFNIPYFKNPKVYLEPVNSYVSPEKVQKKIIIIVDGYTELVGVKATYIKLPEVPATDSYCYLDYTLYSKLVDTAVNKAITDLAKLASSRKGGNE